MKNVKGLVVRMRKVNVRYKKWQFRICQATKCLTACLIFCLAFGLAGCGNTYGNAEETTGATDYRDADREQDVWNTTVHVGSMKGATTLGLLSMMDESKKGNTNGTYEFTMATTADELLPMVIREELDIALVPANVASVLYQKTEGGIAVIDINTLGVLYMVSGDTSVQSMEDLKGRTVYLTGKGTTPDYVLHYLLTANGLSESDVKLEYKSEATEVAVLLAEQPESIGLLPQPFVTAACVQNEELSVVLDMTAEWEKVQGAQGSSLVTGVTVVRKAFLEEHPGAVNHFLEEHKRSAEYVNANVEESAALAVEAGIIPKEPIAVKAIPKCNITFLEGEEMKQALSGYLEVLYDQAPEAVGGSLPEEDFYYLR